VGKKIIEAVRDLSNTPYSTERLLIWAVGICLIISVIGIVVLSVLQVEIPRPLQSVATFSLGAFVGRIQERKEPNG
jgi:hypothetical protein